jgi:glutamate-1-semialdehyde 2,1-aminomutase
MKKMPGPTIKKSNQIYARAEQIIPAGSQTFSKGVTQFVEGFAPKYIQSGKGAYTYDVDGNRYLDYIMACHPIILGYADPDVNQAVIQQLELGSTFSLMNELEVDVTELLIQTVPCAEMARFGKNGADATSAGVRIGRAVTGRDHVAYCGYHGWHDWYIANTDLNDGIPRFNQELAHSFEYNNLDSLEQIFQEHPEQVAIVIMEPLTISKPRCMKKDSGCGESQCHSQCQQTFLHEVKRMAHHYGALLMFDEVITGFRFSVGGAQELVGVTPDLTAIAKGISNGVPLSAIVGKKEYMSVLNKTFFSFTYGGDCLGLAAASACIPKICRENVPSHLDIVGERLKSGLNLIFEENQISDYLQCVGYPCRSIVALDGQGQFDNLEMKSFVQQELIRRGILWAGYHAISWSHKEEEIDTTLSAFSEVAELLSSLIRQNVNLRSFIEGKPVRPVFRKVSDFNSFINKTKT